MAPPFRAPGREASADTASARAARSACGALCNAGPSARSERASGAPPLGAPPAGSRQAASRAKTIAIAGADDERDQAGADQHRLHGDLSARHRRLRVDGARGRQCRASKSGPPNASKASPATSSGASHQVASACGATEGTTSQTVSSAVHGDEQEGEPRQPRAAHP